MEGHPIQSPHTVLLRSPMVPLPRWGWCWKPQTLHTCMWVHADTLRDSQQGPSSALRAPAHFSLALPGLQTKSALDLLHQAGKLPLLFPGAAFDCSAHTDQHQLTALSAVPRPNRRERGAARSHVLGSSGS